MHPNEKLIHDFYKAFASLDYVTMQKAYADDAIFYDPVFEHLTAGEVKAMWQMLCTNAKGFSLTHRRVIADADYGSCDWTAHYIFSATGRSVVNKIHAHFRFQHGKILEHQDNFSLYKWSRQALGLPGMFLGWSRYMQKKIRKQAKANLHNFTAVKEKIST
jgi:ketosteroid isomerase-like protein